MKKILILVHDQTEDLELWYPVYRLREEGYTVVLASEKAGMKFHGKYGVPYEAQFSWDSLNAVDYAGLMIPGGWAPDKIRRYENAKRLVKEFDQAGKPIGEICHAGLVTLSAGIIKGRRVTSTLGIRDDMVNAGGIWTDEAVVVDGNLVSSRGPEDLPQYMPAFIALLKEGVTV